MNKNKNKKRFSDGLDSLFSDALESTNRKKITQQEKSVKNSKPQVIKKSGPKKSFSSDLEFFFQDAIEDAVQEAAQEITTKGSTALKTVKRRTKPNFGIDSLIRSTIESSTVLDKSAKKRITFTFDTERIDELKRLAKIEKARVRDIVGQLISQYIKEHKV